MNDEIDAVSRRTMFELTGKSALAAIAGGSGGALLASPTENGLPADDLTSAWFTLSRTIEQFSVEFGNLGAPPHDLDRAEAHRLFLRYLSIGMDQSIEYTDPAFPDFYQKTRDGVRKFAGDSPEQLYDTATVSGDYDYVVSGNIKDVFMIELGAYSGSLSSDSKAQRRLVDSITERDMEFDKNGDFTVLLGKEKRGGNSLLLDRDSSVVSVRRYLRDPIADKPRPLTIKRVSGRAELAPLTGWRLSEQLIKAANFASWNVRTWASWVSRMRHDPSMFNRIVGFDDSGDLYTPSGHRYLHGYWSIPAGQALLISFVPPAVKYWSFVPMNYWMESFEWRFGNKVFASSFNTRPDS
ncbi:MAG: hypothetical protein ACREB5_09575, partial [Sphingomonadaceae bacterium]